MGRTIPSFRIAAEIERTKWNQFRTLLDKKDRKEFDQLQKLFPEAEIEYVYPLFFDDEPEPTDEK